MNEDTQFLNGAFGIESQRDIRNVMTQLRACQRTCCNDRMDEFGRCIYVLKRTIKNTALLY